MYTQLDGCTSWDDVLVGEFLDDREWRHLSYYNDKWFWDIPADRQRARQLSQEEVCSMMKDTVYNVLNDDDHRLMRDFPNWIDTRAELADKYLTHYGLIGLIRLAAVVISKRAVLALQEETNALTAGLEEDEE